MTYELNDFQTDIIDASMTIPVVVDFWAPWCEPCKALGPILEKMASMADGRWSLVKINVDEHQEMAQSFQVQSIPAVYLVSKGQVEDVFTGALPEAEITAWLTPHLGVEVVPEPVIAEGLSVDDLLAAGNEEQALVLQRELVAAEPEEHELRVKLAEMLLFSATEEACDLLTTIDAASKSHDHAEKLLMLASCLLDNGATLPAHPSAQTYYAAGIKALAERNYELAVDQFLEVLYRDKTYHEDAARKGIIGIFDYLGRAHEITKGYQRRFEMALF